MLSISCVVLSLIFFFQAEDGIRDLVRSRGLGDVYKRQVSVRDFLAQLPASGGGEHVREDHSGSNGGQRAQGLSLIHI